MINGIQDSVFAIDSHCHLDLIEKTGISLATIISEAQKANVRILQTICTSFAQLPKIANYSKEYDFIYHSVGLHPCNVTEENILDTGYIMKLIEDYPKAIGIGETGLDFYHESDNYQLQQQSFAYHVEASQESRLPLIIHSRNADKEMAEIIISTQRNKAYPAILHCFSSSKELAEIAVENKVYLSIAGIVTFKGATELQEVVRETPLEMMLIETDSPYLAPTPHRGKTNHPALIVETAKKIGEIKNISTAEVLKITSENFLRIFTKVQS
jgi:TatD DNase family protein